MSGRRIIALMAGLELVAGLVTGWTRPALASTPIVVNSTHDPGDGTCDQTECTLREAITLANAQSGADEIDFHIPGSGTHVIAPASPLPAITGTVTIDAYTEGGAGSTSHVLELDGTHAGTSDGLVVQAPQTVIEGFSIGNFSGNGVTVDAGGATVEGNEIGLNPQGFDIGNGGDGVLIDGDGDLVGGTTSAERNVISDNTGHGVSVTAVGNGQNEVSGNFIGTTITGGAAAGNGEDGVDLESGIDTTVGGSAPGAGNVISGNGVGGSISKGEDGIEFRGAVANTVIEDNRIGTDATGTVAIGNVGEGIFDGLDGADGTDILGNLVAANGEGMLLFSGNAAVQGNRIGTNAAGTASLGPQANGIVVEGPNVTIGAAFSGGGNLVSGNTGAGILSEGAVSEVIQGNLIGTTKDGTHALGNGGDGILLDDVHGALVGGTATGDGNVVAANGGIGILIADGSVTTIQGNSIGTDPSGTAVLGNQSNGIEIREASGSIVGGGSAAAGNLIRNNGAEGVVITELSPGTTNGNQIRRNAIAANGISEPGLGIDLGADGVTPNDGGDADTGPNRLQNFPGLTSAVLGASSTAVKIRLSSGPNKRFGLDFFSSAKCDPSGHGEGGVYLKTVAVTTNGSGLFAGQVTLPRVARSHVITATATDPAGDTSEFSACRTVT